MQDVLAPLDHRSDRRGQQIDGERVSYLSGDFEATLGLDVGHRVKVKFTTANDNAIGGDYFIESVTHTYRASNNTLDSQFTLSKATT